MILALLAACTAEPACEDIDPVEGFCPHLYTADAVQDIYLTLSSDTWQALALDYVSWESRAPDERKPYHPVEEFRWGCERIYNAEIRLKGNPCCSWQSPKLQFVVAFHKQDPKGRFQGLRKIGFDSPSYDPTVLSERLAFAAMEDMGATASCANNTRLHINGALYGVYTSAEMVDKEYLQRRYDDDDEGNLFKFDHGSAAMVLRTNEEANDTSDYDALDQNMSFDALDAVFDLDQMLQTAATETIVLQADGFWAGSLNFYLYNHPTRGWLVLPWDLDHAYDYWPADVDPLVRQDYFGVAWELDRVLLNADGRQRFIDAVKSNYAAYDVGLTLDRLERWDALIRPDLELEFARPFTMEEHDQGVIQLRDAILARDAYLNTWVQEH